MVSFAPQVAADTGNGTHLHVSLWEGERNLLAGGDGPAGMQPRGEAFMAGILRRAARDRGRHGADHGGLPPAAAASLVGRDAVLGHWRTARPRCGSSPASTPETAGGANVEVKPVDGTANPYLAVGAVLAAGLHGLDAGDRLPPSTEEDPRACPTT